MLWKRSALPPSAPLISSSLPTSVEVIRPERLDSSFVKTSARACSVSATSADFAPMPAASSRPPSLSVLATSRVCRARTSVSALPRAARPSSMRCASPSSEAPTSRRRWLALASVVSRLAAITAAKSWLRCVRRSSRAPPPPTTVFSIAVSLSASCAASERTSSPMRVAASWLRATIALSNPERPSWIASSTVRPCAASARSIAEWCADGCVLDVVDAAAGAVFETLAMGVETLIDLVAPVGHDCVDRLDMAGDVVAQTARMRADPVYDAVAALADQRTELRQLLIELARLLRQSVDNIAAARAQGLFKGGQTRAERVVDAVAADRYRGDRLARRGCEFLARKVRDFGPTRQRSASALAETFLGRCALRTPWPRSRGRRLPRSGSPVSPRRRRGAREAEFAGRRSARPRRRRPRRIRPAPLKCAR